METSIRFMPPWHCAQLFIPMRKLIWLATAASAGDHRVDEGFRIKAEYKIPDVRCFHSIKERHAIRSHASIKPIRHMLCTN